MIQQSKHPYAMYDAIHAQAGNIDSIVPDNQEAIHRLAHLIESAHATTLVGIGSSLHSAQLAVALWREVRPTTCVTAEHSYDVASGFTNLRPEVLGDAVARHLVVALSHRGTKRYTNQALRMAKEMGAMTCSITGKGVTGQASEADLHITATEQERSAAHTASLLGSFTICAAVMEQLAPTLGGNLMPALKDAVAVGLSTEQSIHAFAREVPAHIRHIWLVGAGSDAIVAREIALKIKETSYIPSEGMSVEEFAHGPFQCVDPRDQILFVDTQPFASERISSVRAMAETVGTPSLTITTDERASTLATTTRIVAVPSATLHTLTSMSALVVLQLFTYFLALERGTDPDRFRLDDPKFKSAASLIKL